MGEDPDWLGGRRDDELEQVGPMEPTEQLRDKAFSLERYPGPLCQSGYP